MQAADIVETLPTAGLDEGLLTAISLLVEHRLPGLAVTDSQGEVVGCVSSIDLLRAVLPRYLHGDSRLARVFDESAADRIVKTLSGVRVRDVVGELTPIPAVRPRATAVELAELMVERGSSIVLVDSHGGSAPGVVTANHLLNLLLVAAAEGAG